MDYQRIVDAFKAGRLTDSQIQQHLSDLMMLLDFATSLNVTAGASEIGNLVLLSLMGYTHSRRSILLLASGDDWEVAESKGFRSLPSLKKWDGHLPAPYPECHLFDRNIKNSWNDLCEILSVQVLIPVRKQEKLLAVIGIGGKAGQKSYTDHETQMAAMLAQMCAGALENSVTRQTLQSLNRQLTLKVYQLNSLFELSKDFHSVWDSETIFRILGTSLIGQLLVSRCAVFTRSNNLLDLKFHRGMRLQPDELRQIQELPLESVFADGNAPLLCSSIDSRRLQSVCVDNKIHLILPMVFNDEIRGLILLGERKNRKPYCKEDFDFISTLGNLALVADENSRMQQQMVEKHRMERELAIAREIQVGLLPRVTPKIPGYQIDSFFLPCFTVGGDYFDFIPVSGSRMVLAIGDVSGKSTPAALLMACLQSALRALTSVDVIDPEFAIQKINKLLCEGQTQSNKYVTFFYAILDHHSHEAKYVNAGHCYPLIIKKNGSVVRLETGGTVLGFFQDAIYRAGSYNFDSGDLMILYTDGVSELSNLEEEEFGVERLTETLRKHHAKPVPAIKEELVKALDEHRAGHPQNDDITFVLLKRL